MAMHSSSPDTPMTSQQLLPLLLMKDDSANEDLIVFMSMMSQLENCAEHKQTTIKVSLRNILSVFSINPWKHRTKSSAEEPEPFRRLYFERCLQKTHDINRQSLLYDQDKDLNFRTKISNSRNFMFNSRKKCLKNKVN